MENTPRFNNWQNILPNYPPHLPTRYNTTEPCTGFKRVRETPSARLANGRWASQPTGGGRIGNALNARHKFHRHQVGPADTAGDGRSRPPLAVLAGATPAPTTEATILQPAEAEATARRQRTSAQPARSRPGWVAARKTGREPARHRKRERPQPGSRCYNAPNKAKPAPKSWFFRSLAKSGGAGRPPFRNGGKK